MFARARISDSKSVSAGWWSTVILFLVHGLVVSTWVSRIPVVQSTLSLSNGVLGLTLLSSAIGAVSSIPVVGFLVSRYGSKKVSIFSSLLFCLSVILPALAFNSVTLSIALLIFGAAAASMDVSMNAQGVDVEKALGAPTMSRFHGMFSLGGMIGAGLGGLVAAHGIKVLPHFAVSSALNLLAVAIASRFLLDTHQAATQAGHRLPLSKIPRVLFALSAIGFCILLSEGAMGDWTAVYLKQVLERGSGYCCRRLRRVLRLNGDLSIFGRYHYCPPRPFVDRANGQPGRCLWFALGALSAFPRLVAPRLRRYGRRLLGDHPARFRLWRASEIH